MPAAGPVTFTRGWKSLPLEPRRSLDGNRVIGDWEIDAAVFTVHTNKQLQSSVTELGSLCYSIFTFFLTFSKPVLLYINLNITLQSLV